MSTNCMKCGVARRTGHDLLCDGCRAKQLSADRVPGEWWCPRCGFVQLCSTMYVASGEIGVSERDNTARQICPNDGADMFRPTWEQAAREARKLASEMMAIVNPIHRLRDNDGSSVEILCDNPEPETKAETVAVVVTDEWTNWQPLRFYGATLAAALESAMHEKSEKQN